MIEYLQFLADLSHALAALGLVTVVLSMLKRSTERRRSRTFKDGMDEWTDGLRAAGIRLDQHALEDELKAECERELYNAGFSPLEIAQILDVSLAVAKGIAVSKFLI